MKGLQCKLTIPESNISLLTKGQRRPLPGARNEPSDTLVDLEANDVPYQQSHTSCELSGTRAVSVSAAKRCDACNRFRPDCSLCNVCGITFCNKCWITQLSHRLGTRGPDDVPHEKTSHDIAEKIQAVLEPKITDEQRRTLHRRDENTTWFGVARNEMDDIIFQDCGRYAALMASCSSSRKDHQHPTLVSFVGQTGKFMCS